MCMLPYLLLPNGGQNRLLFSLNSSLLQKSLHSGGLQLTSHPLGLEVLPSHREEVLDWVISSDLLPSMTLTHLPFSNAPLLVAPLLTSSLLPLLLPFLALGRCFRTWSLTTYQFFYPPLSFRPIAPTSIPLPSIFGKLAEMTLPTTLIFTVYLQRNTRLFLFPLLLLSLPLWH